ncbi:efflux RND transporter permease subunit, partial [Escherichia coli]|uniref:efflux RND transporter permease subunit n=1 Tax=Escherichia coli TaxID=562 RepID=UPI0013D7782D
VYEGEKRFDMVVRLEKTGRQSIEDVKGLFVAAPDGNQIPLEQVADISLVLGPNQIQREDAKRRIIVGFNTR